MKTVKFDLINEVNAGGKDLLLSIEARIAVGSLEFVREYMDSDYTPVMVYKTSVGNAYKAEVHIDTTTDGGYVTKTVTVFYRGRVYQSSPIIAGKTVEQNAANQPEVIETPAVKVSETVEAIIENLATAQTASTDRLIELPADTSFEKSHLTPAMLEAANWTVTRRDGKIETATSPQGAILTVKQDRASLQDGVLYQCETVTYRNGARYIRLYFISADTDGTKWEHKRAAAINAGLLARPLTQKIAGLDFDALPITAIPPQTQFGFSEFVKTKTPYRIEGVSYNRICGDVTARPMDMDAWYFGRTESGKHRFEVPTADIQDRWVEYTDHQLARVLKSVASL